MARVLVVDDDEAIRALLREALEDEGYAVQEAADGAQALGMLGRARPDAVLLDLMMPVLDGWGFLRAAADLPRAGLPIVVMSAASNLSAAAQELLGLGVRAWLPKPFDLDALLGMVGQLCPAERPEVDRVPGRADTA
jgi:two-component system, chemotaxis family, chemotaxis protein CheY